MAKSRSKYICIDCHQDTGKIKEFYFINTNTWLTALGSKQGMLCIGCLEKRLGRELRQDDFPNVTINSPRYGDKSQRLMQRMNNVGP